MDTEVAVATVVRAKLNSTFLRARAISTKPSYLRTTNRRAQQQQFRQQVMVEQQRAIVQVRACVFLNYICIKKAFFFFLFFETLDERHRSLFRTQFINSQSIAGINVLLRRLPKWVEERKRVLRIVWVDFWIRENLFSSDFRKCILNK